MVLCPLIGIERRADEPIDVPGYDWVVVTSRNGARELVRRMRVARAAGRDRTGDGGGAPARPPELVPAVSTQEGLLAALPRPAGRVLFAGAEGARRLLVDELGADFVPLYRTRELRPAAFPDGDLVVLGSASAARAYAALGVRAGRLDRPADHRARRRVSTSWRRPSRTTWTGLVAAVAVRRRS